MFHAILVYIQAVKQNIILQGRLSDGRNYGIFISNFRPRFFIPESDLELAMKHMRNAVDMQEGDWKNMRGGAVRRLEFETYSAMQHAQHRLHSVGIPCYESDLTLAQQFLIERGIGLYFGICGIAEQGDVVDLRFINPKIYPPPADSWPADILRIIAINIETNCQRHIRCVSIVGNGISRILTLQRRLPQCSEADISEFENESLLLRGLIHEIRNIDPDIITGWNVTAFDMDVILRRMATFNIAAELGRSKHTARFFIGAKSDNVDLPGRQVIDAMRLQRMNPDQFESFNLEYVASKILKRGRREHFDEDSKAEALDHLWEHDPIHFLLYCLESSQLVIDILKKTKLIELTLKRSELCGTSISRAWASIHSFEQLYIRELHKKNIVASNLGMDRLPMNESLGGTILAPESGLFDRVLLLDFKGLYPSIIRSFGIDTLAHIVANGGAGHEENRALEFSGSIVNQQNEDGSLDYEVGRIVQKSDESENLRSPNGTLFSRKVGILPEILTRFYQLREEAKADGDEIASYTFKILANSFYGVLGSSGCRFAGSDIATAITSFAKQILYWSRDFANALGFRTIYGDTDSLFLLPPPKIDTRDLFRLGNELSRKINADLAKWVQETYQVESCLEIEFENVFAPLFIPPLKSISSKEIQKELKSAEILGTLGRSKSYAGRAFNEDGFHHNRYELVIKGMEAVRSDWTKLARNIQRDILHKIFNNAERQEIAEYLSKTIQHIQTPEGRDLLIIKKRLSKHPSQYKGSLPPHVRAALLAEKRQPGSLVSRNIQYLMTSNGPEPLLRKDSSIQPDIAWYVKKQILPVLQSINDAVPYDLSSMIESYPDGQLSLWS